MSTAFIATLIVCVLLIVGALLLWAFDWLVNTFARLLPRLPRDDAIRESLNRWEADRDR